MIVSPVTGEVIPDELPALEEAERRVDRYLRGQIDHYQFRRECRERIAELRGPAELPHRRLWSGRQARVAACPRCGMKEVS